jgi:glutamate--cysteine ligase
MGTELQRRIADAGPAIERWLREQWELHDAPFYGSVDMRDGGYKLAPVDINLFPGGFNNLNPQSDANCLPAILATIERISPGSRKLLVVPENHTRNTGYVENVIALQAMLTRAGAEVRVGSSDPGVTAATRIEAKNGTLMLEPLRRNGNRIGVANFEPSVVLLNNDLSAGCLSYCEISINR